MKYFAIVRLAHKDYITKVEASSLMAAENMILEEGICTKFGFGVDDVIAYDNESMKTECFIVSALSAEPVGYLDLVGIIHRHNENLKEKAAAHHRITEIERQMKALEAELKAAKEILSK